MSGSWMSFYIDALTLRSFKNKCWTESECETKLRKAQPVSRRAGGSLDEHRKGLEVKPIEVWLKCWISVEVLSQIHGIYDLVMAAILWSEPSFIARNTFQMHPWLKKNKQTIKSRHLGQKNPPKSRLNWFYVDQQKNWSIQKCLPQN